MKHPRSLSYTGIFACITALCGCSSLFEPGSDWPVATITVTPAAETTAVGVPMQFRATLRDKGGWTLTGRPVTWSSNMPSVADVSPDGNVTGRSKGGPVTITASSEGHSGSASVTVAASVASVVVSPTNVSVPMGTVAQLSATLRDSDGDSLTNRAIYWSTPTPAIATVSFTGMLTAIGPGMATITATSEGHSATATIRVTAVFTAISASQLSHTCALMANGRAYCWGFNPAGQLGDGTKIDRASPVAVTGGLSFASITSGGAHTCALGPTGAAYCWGAGQGFGNGVGTNSATPVTAGSGLRFTAMSAAPGVTCGLAEDRSAYCWGANFDEQLGDGTTVERTSPSRVTGGLTFASLAVGGRCALTAEGVAYCWGRNDMGQLGSGFQTGVLPSPVPVYGELRFTQLAAGWTHTCGITRDGATYCWGDNASGQLGIGSFARYAKPGLVASGLRFTQIGAGASFTCALAEGGAAYCWGFNQDGRGGDGTLVSHVFPSPVAGGLRFTSLSVGAAFACGLTDTGDVYCWGANNYGQLGDGTTVNRPVPTLVR